MDAKLVANYFAQLKEKNGFTIEVWAEKSGGSVSTLKNLLSGKTEDPRLATVTPYIYAAGGSVDEMYTGKTEDEIKEISINSIKEIYEQQLAERAKTEEAHINDIRAHYEQHRHDTITNYERLLKEKSSQATFFKILSCVGLGILILLLILEVTNPNLGWIKF